MRSEGPFDAAYFGRFYESTETRVYGPEQIACLARGVTGLIGWFGRKIETVLDVGAGVGLWRDWFAEHEKGARYTSIDVSDYACLTYGHQKRDITRWRGRGRFDLIVCQGVLPYFDDEGLASAIDNMAAMSRGFLYLEAVTARDLRGATDAAYTDAAMRARPASAYRRLLGPHFEAIGCGLHYAKSAPPLPFYELERCPKGR